MSGHTTTTGRNEQVTQWVDDDECVPLVVVEDETAIYLADRKLEDQT